MSTLGFHEYKSLHCRVSGLWCSGFRAHAALVSALVSAGGLVSDFDILLHCDEIGVLSSQDRRQMHVVTHINSVTGRGA